MPSNASVIVRAELSAGPEVLSHVMTAITMAGGEVDGMDTVRSTRETITRDIVILGADEQATDAIVQSLGSVQGVTVHGVTNAIFRAHEGGMLTMRTRIPVRNRDDLSMAYTPGVARVCMAIHDNLDRAWDLTIKGNSVMVISDGSALVGQGDLGPLAALPVLEGLSLFMREMAAVDAFPLPIDLDSPPVDLDFGGLILKVLFDPLLVGSLRERIPLLRGEEFQVFQRMQSLMAHRQERLIAGHRNFNQLIEARIRAACVVGDPVNNV